MCADVRRVPDAIQAFPCLTEHFARDLEMADRRQAECGSALTETAHAARAVPGLAGLKRLGSQMSIRRCSALNRYPVQRRPRCHRTDAYYFGSVG